MNRFLGAVSSALRKRTVISIAGRNQFVVKPRPAASEDAKTSRLTFRRLRENDTPLTSVSEDAPPRIQRKAKPSSSLPDTSTLASGLTVRLLNTRLIKNMTKNGKYARFSISLAVGNGAGGLAVAHAKAVAAVDAISKATRRADRSMEHFERWQHRTLHHDDVVKFKATLLYVRPAAPESGRRAHPAIIEMCRCMGIKDISAKVHGSRNPLNVAQAFLMALRRQKTPVQVAQESGMRIIDVLKAYQMGCEELTRTLRSERYSNDHLKS